MAAPLVPSNKSMKRLESRKSHSWWWDSHINPKNSKWLAENLEEMDRLVKRMLKLVEEDGDSFAKKAEMYHQKRPELLAHVEEFYRLYRSLAERYDHVTAELKKNVPSDLQSVSSSVSDIGSELPSTWSSPDLQKLNRRKSGGTPRAAGFDFFLGTNGNSSDNYQKEGEESASLTGTELDSDDDGSSVNNYSEVLSNSGGDVVQQRKIIDLEIELRELKEKLRLQQEGNPDSSFKGSKNEKSEEVSVKIAEYAQELTIANEKLQASEEEISRLNDELKWYKPSENDNTYEAGLESDMEINEASEIPRSGEVQDSDNKIKTLVEELRITKLRLQHSQKEITSLRQEIERNKTSSKQESSKASQKINQLQGQLDSANKDITTWKTKLNSEKREVTKLKERIARLKTSLSDRDHEVMDLKIAVSDAEEKIFPEKSEVKAAIARLYLERTQLEEQIREWESRARSLEDEIRMIKAGKTEMEERLTSEIEQFKAEILEISNHIGNLNKALDVMKAERDELSTKVVTLKAKVSYRDERVNDVEMQLQQLQKEQVKLVSGDEGARKMVEELTVKTKALEEEVQRQRVIILEGAEEKREAIRQLCFSLEHYRNDYHRLRQAYMGHKSPVFAN